MSTNNINDPGKVPIGPTTLLAGVVALLGAAGAIVSAIESQDTALVITGVGTFLTILVTLIGRYGQAVVTRIVQAIKIIDAIEDALAAVRQVLAQVEANTPRPVPSGDNINPKLEISVDGKTVPQFRSMQFGAPPGEDEPDVQLYQPPGNAPAVEIPSTLPYGRDPDPIDSKLDQDDDDPVLLDLLDPHTESGGDRVMPEEIPADIGDSPVVPNAISDLSDADVQVDPTDAGPIDASEPEDLVGYERNVNRWAETADADDDEED